MSHWPRPPQHLTWTRTPTTTCMDYDVHDNLHGPWRPRQLTWTETSTTTYMDRDLHDNLHGPRPPWQPTLTTTSTTTYKELLPWTVRTVRTPTSHSVSLCQRKETSRSPTLPFFRPRKSRGKPFTPTVHTWLSSEVGGYPNGRSRRRPDTTLEKPNGGDGSSKEGVVWNLRWKSNTHQKDPPSQNSFPLLKLLRTPPHVTWRNTCWLPVVGTGRGTAWPTVGLPWLGDDGLEVVHRVGEVRTERSTPTTLPIYSIKYFRESRRRLGLVHELFVVGNNRRI